MFYPLITAIINELKSVFRRSHPTLKVIGKILLAIVVTAAINGLVASIRVISSYYYAKSPPFTGLNSGVQLAGNMLENLMRGFMVYYFDNIIGVFEYFYRGSAGSIVVLTLILLIIYLFFAKEGFRRFFAGLNETLKNLEKGGLSSVAGAGIGGKPEKDVKRDVNMSITTSEIEKSKSQLGSGGSNEPYET